MQVTLSCLSGMAGDNCFRVVEDGLLASCPYETGHALGKGAK